MTVDLVPTWQVGDVELTRYPFSVDRNDSVEIGEPALVVESVESLLADGDDERVVRYGNRSYAIPIYIEGADLADLAESEALLRREIQRPGLELAHNPGDDFSPTSVYEVRTAALTPSRSDTHESHLMRKFTLTLTCAPFARSAEMVTSTAGLEPIFMTPRQSSRVIEPGGTERTPASIHVASTTGVDGLGGLVMVHTCPEDGSGYSPPLSRHRTSASTGPQYADANTLSGYWEDIAYTSGGFYAEVPTSALPEGGYVLMARLRSATADLNQATLFWSTSTIFPDTTTQQGFTNGNIKIALGATPTIVPVAALSLPSVRTKAGKVQVVLQVSNTSGPQVQLDDAWLFRADDDCALTIVNNWHDHLWLDSPDATSPVPRVWIGDGRSIQAHPGEALMAMGSHILHPDGTAVYAAAMSDFPATDATFYRRWHSNAAE